MDIIAEDVSNVEKISNSVDNFLGNSLGVSAIILAMLTLTFFFMIFRELSKKRRILSQAEGYRNPHGFSMPVPKVWGTVFLTVLCLGATCVAIWLWLPYSGITI